MKENKKIKVLWFIRLDPRIKHENTTRKVMTTLTNCRFTPWSQFGPLYPEKQVHRPSPFSPELHRPWTHEQTDTWMVCETQGHNEDSCGAKGEVELPD